MRKVLMSLLSVSWLGLAGCGHYCTHGACDCWLDDHCCTRAPWVYQRPPVALGAPVGVLPAPVAAPAPLEVAPPPAALPPVKEASKEAE